MKDIRKIFFRGLVSLLPITVTIYIAYAGVLIIDDFLGHLLRFLFKDYYFPGLGFIITLVLIFLLGLLLNNFIFASILRAVERNLTKIPFIKAIYSPLKDVMNLFSHGGKQGLKSVVLVNMGNGIHFLGLITREDFNDLPLLPPEASNMVSVYCPFSYALGGYTMLVSRDKITPVDIPIEKAMSLSITAWIKTEKKVT